MEFRASLSFLVLLFGFCQALYLKNHQYVDMTTQILSTNNGSVEMLVEGDILIPKNKNAMICPDQSCLWEKSSNGLVKIPYTVSRDFSSDDKLVIADAIKTFQKKTCIRFIPRTDETDYISIENEDGCYSSMGKTGGVQVLSLNRNSCVYKGIAQHELNHALGFYHEHTRSDRDKYVVVYWKNIESSQKFNFDLNETNNLGTPYDYSSVMHYGKSFFSINGKPTLVPIPDSSVEIGQREDLSKIDIQRINLLYKC